MQIILKKIEPKDLSTVILMLYELYLAELPGSFDEKCTQNNLNLMNKIYSKHLLNNPNNYLILYDEKIVGYVALASQIYLRKKINSFRLIADSIYELGIFKGIKTVWYLIKLQNLVCFKLDYLSNQLHSLIIKKSFRNNMLGEKTVIAVESIVSSLGFKDMHLFVLDKNPALTFYIRNGYKIHKIFYGMKNTLCLKYRGFMLTKKL